MPFVANDPLQSYRVLTKAKRKSIKIAHFFFYSKISRSVVVWLLYLLFLRNDLSVQKSHMEEKATC